jgi:L-threonylcarbamoyladenylate synthase
MIIPDDEIEILSRTLRNDGVIAFPTDTVWGVGCLVSKEEAVEKIYKMKGRDKTKPLILLGASLEYLLPYVEPLSWQAKEFADRYFPGALTIVLPKSGKTPSYVTSGYDTVGIRVPEHPVLLEALERVVDTHVLATTSANISGKGALSSRQDVEKILGSSVDHVMDDYGFSPQGKESTVIRIETNGEITVLRQGVINISIGAWE